MNQTLKTIHNQSFGVDVRAGLVLFSLTILLTFVTNACNNAAGEEGTDEIRVMSYNIAAGYGDLNRIADVISEHNPDLVALQEVDVFWSERSNFEDQARLLGEALDMHYFYGEIYTFDPHEDGMPARRYGLAYLSRVPFDHAENYPLVRLSTQSEEPELIYLPGFPAISVTIHGREVHLFNTHLDYRSDPAVREQQVSEMLTVINRYHGPMLLLGDLNARPGSPELDPLFELFSDAWDDSTGPGYTFPGDDPDRRIDYILHTNDFEVRSVFVPETEASDHRPVVADLLFR
jgi:endonuclease/exonuclease/phosphatase family metal-dependent hydrolase